MKIVVALRRDLLDRVFRLTRDAGFQEEKYESICLPLHWSRETLVKVIEYRVNCLLQRKYTKQKISPEEILPRNVHKVPVMDYITLRTLMRPRDTILFVNECIRLAKNKSELTAKTILEAEGAYSAERLRSLGQEWYADYPNLENFSRILRARNKTFSAEELLDQKGLDFCFDFVVRGQNREDLFSTMAKCLVDCDISERNFVAQVLSVFHKVGLVALKLESFQKSIPPSTIGRKVTPEEIHPNTNVSIHPMFWRALGILEK